MDYDQIKEKTLAFFEVSVHPNIIGKRKKLEILLTDILQVPVQTSIKIIDGIVNGLLELMVHSFIPCQIKYEHVARCDQKWGITNVICYRTQQEDNDQYPTQVYDNVEYEDHITAQNQLIWNIGKIWFQMVTQTQLPYIFQIQQSIIHKNIQKCVKDQQIRRILTKMLTIDCQKRLTFKELIQSGVLFSCYDEQEASIKSSLVTHFYQFQSNKIFQKSQQKMQEQLIPGCFQEQLFYRNFRDQLQIDKFIEQTKRVVKAQFCKQSFNLSTSELKQIEFSFAIVDAMRYHLFQNILDTKFQKGYQLPVQLNNDYNNFINQMLVLQRQVNKVKKMQKFKQYQSKQDYQVIFASRKIRSQKRISQQNSPNTDYIITSFKQNHMNALIKKLKQVYNLHIQEIDKLEATRMVTKLMLLRCIDYVFQSCRSYLFEDLFENKRQIQTGFTVNKIIKKINSCNDMNLLRSIEQKIKELYF